jgi:hypothetical protein
MQILDVLNEMGGVQSLARELGISESQAATGAAALVPALLGGFKSQAQSHPSGLDGLAGMLGGLGGGGLLDEVLSPQPANGCRAGRRARRLAGRIAWGRSGWQGRRHTRPRFDTRPRRRRQPAG